MSKKPLPAPVPEPEPATVSYVLRQIDPLIWRQLKSKAALQGISLQALINRILNDAAK